MPVESGAEAGTGGSPHRHRGAGRSMAADYIRLRGQGAFGRIGRENTLTMTTPTKTTKTPPRAVSAQMRGVGDGGRIEATTNFLPKPTDSVLERPTPETDAFVDEQMSDPTRGLWKPFDALVDFARRLERSLAEVRKKLELSAKAFVAIDSLNASYVAAWREVTGALGQREEGDQSSDIDRVLKAIRERDEAREKLAELYSIERELEEARAEVARLRKWIDGMNGRDGIWLQGETK